MAERDQFTWIAGRQLRLSNREKVMYPETGTTKGEVIDYFTQVAPALIPFAAGRPVTRKRWVDGVAATSDPGRVFFRKDLESSAPDWVPRVSYSHKNSVNTYPLATEPAVLAWFGQVAALELHVPQWRFDPDGNAMNPDRFVLDLDPGEGVGLAECARVALLCKEVLDDMDLLAVPVTSGSTGLHVYAHLDGGTSSDEASALAKELARAIEADHPDLAVSTMAKEARRGKVFIDWSQNNAAKTTVCPYSLRGRMRPSVAAPRTWAEIDDPDLSQLEFHHVLDRLAGGADPMATMAPAATTGGDGLAQYRSMRDPSSTSEPFGTRDHAQSNRGGDGASFVVHEHHASTLHWDLRLERSGVLVSWAVPKGLPLAPDTRCLAIQTEDHPLAYGTFEGSIPAQDYGGGTVHIWDRGTLVVEKWRNDREIIVVLRPDPGGGLGGQPRRYALIRATGMNGKNNWLIQLMKDQPGAAADEDDRAAHLVRRIAGSAAPAAPARPKHTTGSARPLVYSRLPSPMLATAGTETDVAGSHWWFEMKWDGVRAIAFVDAAGEVALLSRTGKPMTSAYPELSELGELAPPRSVLDGEIVALDHAGVPDFGALQQRMQLTNSAEIAAQRRHTPVYYLVFDALQLPARDSRPRRLLQQPYSVRRAELHAQLRAGGHIHLSPVHGDGLTAAMRTSREFGLEGVLAKRADSPYTAGRRSRSWIKIKHQRHQEVVIIGWRPNHQDPTVLASLLLAVPADHGLAYIGRVGTGFSEDDREQIPRQLRSRSRKTAPARGIPNAIARDAQWVTPRWVGEVRYAEMTTAGFLRQPVWRGFRADKSVGDVH